MTTDNVTVERADYLRLRRVDGSGCHQRSNDSRDHARVVHVYVVTTSFGENLRAPTGDRQKVMPQRAPMIVDHPMERRLTRVAADAATEVL